MRRGKVLRPGVEGGDEDVKMFLFERLENLPVEKPS
jgi:hypothetical protein